MAYQYVAYHNTTGEIVRIGLDTGHSPADGETEHGLVVHRIYDIGELTEDEFMNTRVWYNDEWTTVAQRPNYFAYWDTTQTPHAWNWDTNIVLSEVRYTRNMLLAASDWTVMSDSPLTDVQKTEARTYRTTLRDLPSTLDLTAVTGSNDVTWPTPPSFIG